MPYNVKEIFYTLQGEGFHAGRPAVFCRFTSCNLWTGREEDRARAICTFCDTDFVGTNGPGGGRFRDAAALAEAIDRHGPNFILYYGLASRLCSLNRVEEAREAMKLALEEDPYAITSALDSTCFTPIWEYLSEVQDQNAQN